MSSIDPIVNPHIYHYPTPTRFRFFDDTGRWQELWLVNNKTYSISGTPGNSKNGTWLRFMNEGRIVREGR